VLRLMVQNRETLEDGALAYLRWHSRTEQPRLTSGNFDI
jgi:hypothetical protein